MRLVPLLLALAGCEYFKITGDEDDSGDSAEDADGDDTDDPDETDGDTGDTGDTEDTPVDTAICDESFSTAEPAGPECITDVLNCGDSVEGTTEGGSEDYGSDSWEGWYCSVNLDRHDYDGPERVYQIFIPEETTATFELETPCEDLDLFVFYWADPDTCAPVEYSIIDCEAGDDEDDDDRASMWSDVGAYYLVAVDAKDGGTGNFRLSVTCQE